MIIDSQIDIDKLCDPTDLITRLRVIACSREALGVVLWSYGEMGKSNICCVLYSRHGVC